MKIDGIQINFGTLVEIKLAILYTPDRIHYGTDEKTVSIFLGLYAHKNYERTMFFYDAINGLFCTREQYITSLALLKSLEC